MYICSFSRFARQYNMHLYASAICRRSPVQRARTWAQSRRRTCPWRRHPAADRQEFLSQNLLQCNTLGHGLQSCAVLPDSLSGHQVAGSSRSHLVRLLLDRPGHVAAGVARGRQRVRQWHTAYRGSFGSFQRRITKRCRAQCHLPDAGQRPWPQQHCAN